jgi:hypothetical protein
VAGFGTDDVDCLLADAGIVRHRGKIEAVINNARRCFDIRDEFGSLAAYAWRYEPDPSTRPAVLDREALMQLPTSPESVAMSKDLRRRGWSFVGPTTVYSFMEAMGLVNDHLVGCAIREPVEGERRAFRRPGSRRLFARTPRLGAAAARLHVAPTPGSASVALRARSIWADRRAGRRKRPSAAEPSPALTARLVEDLKARRGSSIGRSGSAAIWRCGSVVVGARQRVRDAVTRRSGRRSGTKAM